MAQHAILRFEKHKGNPARSLEAHHERQKEQYASNPTLTQAGVNTTSISSSRRTLLPLHSEPYRAGRMPDKERQHTVCRYVDNRQPGVFQGEIPKGDTGVLPKGTDQIFVLDDGKLVESGTHSELMEKKGLYQRLYHIQQESLGWAV